MKITKGKLRAKLFGLGSERRTIGERIRTNQLTLDDRELLLFLVRITPWILANLKKKTFQVSKLKDMLWGNKSESARDILKEINTEAASSLAKESAANNSSCPLPFTATSKGPLSCAAAEENDSLDPTHQNASAPALSLPDNVIPLIPPKGKRSYPKNRKPSKRGRDAFPGVKPIEIPHAELKAGDICPKCDIGRVYPSKMGIFFKWVGQSCLNPIIYLQEKLRCNSCGWIFAAKMAIDIVASNGSESASAMIAVLKYGCGFPFFRLSKLQGWLKMPISPASLWNQLKEGLIEVVEIIWNQMRIIAAQGDVIHNDDTVNKVLSLIEKQKAPKDPRIPREVEPKKKPRKAISTTGILSKIGEIRILLFFTGHANAGENLEELLKCRDAGLKPPIQMSDASTMNGAGEKKTVESLCLTHGRRGFIRAYRAAKKACAYVILKLQDVYKVEAEAKSKKLTPEQRLALHQDKSGPVMAELKIWLDHQIKTRQVEPNSPLGEAIEYMRNHWSGLTAFLRVSGAPLTNDELEQAFKNVKICLKNALFYKTLFGARVGDMMMSVIHTTILAGENPWDYLVEIQKNREAMKKDPGAWMPWNFRQAIVKEAGAIETQLRA